MDRDYYRCLDTEALLQTARDGGIDEDIAVVLAERLEVLDNRAWHYEITHGSMGGRYTFKQRSIA